MAIVGHSGSGKSTLMNLLGCLDRPSQGKYWLDGEEMGGLSDRVLSRVRNEKIGFVFQGFYLMSGLNALENVELPLFYRNVPKGERRRRAEEALCQVGLSERMNHRPGELSGGQQQRVAIARAIVTRPPLLLADEPTGNLDQTCEQEILMIFEQLHAAGQTVMVITHNSAVAQSAKRRICLLGGTIVLQNEQRFEK